jgi:hypothetical protein
VKIGEFISSNFWRVITRQQDLEKDFKNYCDCHSKHFKTEILMTASDPVEFILKIYIIDNNGNNGEIKSCKRNISD